MLEEALSETQVLSWAENQEPPSFTPAASVGVPERLATTLRGPWALQAGDSSDRVGIQWSV
eukprot:4410868-Pyramimonas_sp.AAC.1